MTSITPKHIIVGMSGGVDSSVAALLLKQQGHHVQGLFMKNWEADDDDAFCPASVDMADAQAVCDQLGIELIRVNFAEEYWQNVFSHFLTEYKAGRTPNPDILCNKEIKFKAFLEYAKQRGADYIATGHYVRRGEANDQFQLLKGLDPLKDQSYFLYALNQAQLAQSLFPIGHLEKTDVRDIAENAGLITHKKKDSTGICFIGEKKFKQFLNDFLPAQPGNIETQDGQVIGAHDGLMFHTLGQRQGLKIGGQKNFSEEPWYVAKKDMSRNVLIAVQGHDHPAMFSESLYTKTLHWINEAPSSFPLRASAKSRYRQSDQACTVYQTHTGFEIRFDEPQRSITPGQSVVLYQDEVCLGGGIIIEKTV